MTGWRVCIKMNLKHSASIKIGLTLSWFAIVSFSYAFQTEFWSKRSIFSVGLAYFFYYSWSRICRQSGQAGIVAITPQSSLRDRVSADLAMLFMGLVSLLVLIGGDRVLHWAFSWT